MDFESGALTHLPFRERMNQPVYDYSASNQDIADRSRIGKIKALLRYHILPFIFGFPAYLPAE